MQINAQYRHLIKANVTLLSEATALGLPLPISDSFSPSSHDLTSIEI